MKIPVVQREIGYESSHRPRRIDTPDVQVIRNAGDKGCIEIVDGRPTLPLAHQCAFFRIVLTHIEIETVIGSNVRRDR
jgi:hypothetical protein